MPARARAVALSKPPTAVLMSRAERRSERALIHEYRACIAQVLDGLTTERLELALEIARIPEQIRGYGHVKERHLHAARAQWSQLMARWSASAASAQPQPQPDPAGDRVRRA